MSFRRRLFCLWIVLSCAWVAAVVWSGVPELRATWGYMQVERELALERANLGLHPVCPTCIAPNHETPRQVKIFYDRLQVGFWRRNVGNRALFAAVLPLIVLAFGWVQSSALGPSLFRWERDSPPAPPGQGAGFGEGENQVDGRGH
jgi:hypothetical protein